MVVVAVVVVEEAVVVVLGADNLQRADKGNAPGAFLSSQEFSLQRWSLIAKAQANCPGGPLFLSQLEKVKLFPSDARTQPANHSFLKPSQ